MPKAPCVALVKGGDTGGTVFFVFGPLFHASARLPSELDTGDPMEGEDSGGWILLLTPTASLGPLLVKLRADDVSFSWR